MASMVIEKIRGLLEKNRNDTFYLTTENTTIWTVTSHFAKGLATSATLVLPMDCYLESDG